MDAGDFELDELSYLQRTHGGTFSDVSLTTKRLEDIDKITDASLLAMKQKNLAKIEKQKEALKLRKAANAEAEAKKITNEIIKKAETKRRRNAILDGNSRTKYLKYSYNRLKGATKLVGRKTRIRTGANKLVKGTKKRWEGAKQSWRSFEKGASELRKGTAEGLTKLAKEQRKSYKILNAVLERLI